MGSTLNYVSRDIRRSRSRWLWRRLIAVAAVLLLGIAALNVAVCEDECRIDAVTGSMSWKTVWLFGATSGPRVAVSPLEVRLKTSGIQWTPAWQFLSNSHRNFLGRAMSYGCGRAPAI